MNFLEIRNKIQIAGFGRVDTGYNISRLSSMGTGGKATALIEAGSLEGLTSILELLDSNNIGFVILGSGTNTVFPDGKIDMVIIKLGKDFDHFNLKTDGTIHVGGSFSTQALVMKAAKQGYDLSYLAGIPGTIGGAVSGNSGTGSWGICDSIITIEAILKYNDKMVYDNISSSNIEYGYRYFKLKDLVAITGLALRARDGKPENILSEIHQNINRRKISQPVKAKTCGCFFKNPPGTEISAGAMIDQCGMKGFSYGGARVSVKHANFIENYENATSEDVMVLSRIIKDKVRDKFNIELEYEVKMIGFSR